MPTSIAQLENWLKKPEDLSLEFKKAENQFSYDKDVLEYCAALSNEGGGKLILGIDPKNHKIIGTKAFAGTYNTLSNKILNRLGIRVDVEEIQHPNGRVLVFHIPAHYISKPIKKDGIYYMRAGESRVPMDEQTLKQKLNQGQQDFSSQIVQGLTLEDFDTDALKNFKKQRADKVGNPALALASDQDILSDVGLCKNKNYTYASLILLGKKEKIDEWCPQAEIIYEWRNSIKQIHHDFRISWRAPYFLVYDEIWQTINARNLRSPFQEGFIQREIYAFDEKSCREAVNNAIAHRDYTITTGSVFILASPEVFTVTSPGGFLPGIKPENILKTEPQWRNRLIADVFEHTKLVERSGQGIDTIFEKSIRQGKGLPNFNGTTDTSVKINISATVKDTGFVQFLEKIINEKQHALSLEEMYELELIREKKMIKKLLYRDKFMELGIVEKVGHGRGTNYILSHQYYNWSNKAGIHTRLRGLTRDQKKQLILNHLTKEGKGYSKDIQEALEMRQADVNNLLRELKKQALIKHNGSRRSGYWTLIT